MKKKLPKSKVAKDKLIPKKIGKEITDVIEVGDVRKLIDRKAKHRPSPCGVSIGHFNITAGTQGAIVKKALPSWETQWKECEGHRILKWLIDIFATGQKLMRRAAIITSETKKVILSNNHVLADELMEGDPLSHDDILQPGKYDGGKQPRDTIGYLVEAVPLKKTGNLVDAAIAVPFEEEGVCDNIAEIGKVKGIANVSVGQLLKKSGRTTGVTQGKTIAKNVTIWVGYDKGDFQFVNQIVTECMSAGGDSGSLVLDENNNAVGLLYAGSDKITLVSPIQEVMKALDITFK